MAQNNQHNQSNNRGNKTLRKERVPVFQQRGNLAVTGEDPNFKYRWVNDVSDTGETILKYLDAGYNFVTKSEAGKLQIGDNYVFDSEFAGGSIIRKPASKRDGGFLYYMKQKRQWYEEDQALKEKLLRKKENQIRIGKSHEGQDIEGGYDPKTTRRKIQVNNRD